MLNVIAMAQKAFPYSHSKILNYCFACVSGNGSHERSYFLFKFGNRGRLIFIDIIFCVAPQKKVQWAKVRRVWSPDVGSFSRKSACLQIFQTIIFVFPLQCEVLPHLAEWATHSRFTYSINV